jgi:hypothetical protein
MPPFIEAHFADAALSLFNQAAMAARVTLERPAFEVFG